MKNKAVVLGANYYIGLSIIRCLGMNGVEVVAVDYAVEGSYGFQSKYCREKLIGPHYKKDPGGLLEFLIDYAKNQPLKPVLFPSADPYVEFMDEHLEVLREYFLINQDVQGLFTKAMNKDSLAVLALKLGTPIPETISPDDKDFNEKIDTVIKFPCLVKPVDSPTFVAKFRKKLFQVGNREELNRSVQMAREAGCEVIVQRLIPGFDDHMYTFDAYLNQNSKITHWLTCQKYRQYPINYGASVYTGQRYVPELFEVGAPFLEGIGWKGFAEIEFKKDAESGKFYMIEVNVRTTNLNVLLLRAGINMPYLAYQELTGIIAPPKVITQNTGLVFWYAFEDLLAVRDYIKTGQLTVLGVLKSYFKKKAHSTWDWNDPKPYLAFFQYKIAKPLLKKIFKK